MKRKIWLALVLSAAMLLTACAKEEPSRDRDKDRDEDKSGYSDSNRVDTDDNDDRFTFGDKEDAASKPEKVDMWDIIPEIPVTDASAFKYEYDSTLGGMVVTDYTGESSEVRIPDTLEDKPVVGVDFGECEKQIEELVMPDSVTGFRLSGTIKKGLENINIPKGVTRIPEGEFSWCWELVGVYIPEGVREIGERAFEECSVLTSVTIPDSVTTIGNRAFSGCFYLASVTIPGGVTTIDYEAFGRCPCLTSVQIPDSVTKLDGRAFAYCISLTSVQIPDSVTEIGETAFEGCEKIQASYKGKTYDYEHLDDLYNAING
ncbi:MAG: leucine-rich repeat domain-containing protein [Oscillospiraceae bacterium]